MDDHELKNVKSNISKVIEPNFHLRVCRTMIYYMGTWPPRGKYRSLYLICTVCSFTLMLGIFLMSEIANLVLSWGNLSRMVAGATLLMTNCTHALKVIIILYNQERIENLLNVIRSDIFSRNNQRYKEILSKYTWQGIFHHIAYQSFGTIAVLCWGFTPIADLIAGRSRKLPMEGWYPYNITVTPAFEITSFHQAIAIIIACFHNIAMDTLVTGFITVACCQLAILKKNLTSIKQFRDNDEEKQYVLINYQYDRNNHLKNDAKPYEDLIQCVKHSNAIFDFTREIQHIFGTVIFFQFLVNCIIICLIAFNISQLQVYIPSVLFGMLMYMCCMTYQIFIYCWHGNELHLHSVSIVLAAYSNDWWYSTKTFRRSLQIIIIRAHRPIDLSAGSVMRLSLQTFVKILRMSYSIFTVLQSTTNN